MEATIARDGSGTYTNPHASFTAGTTIESAKENANLTDIANALTDSIAKDGQTTPTANLPMGGFKHTGYGAGSAATDSAHLGQIQAQAWKWAGTADGTANALTLSPSPAISAYAAGQAFRFIAASNNTGATTVAISGLTTKAVQNNGAALAAGDIASGKMYEIVYDGTAFQLLHIMAATLATLGAQADLDVPSQAEAETGTATDERVWTAQRVAQAIAAQVPTASEGTEGRVDQASNAEIRASTSGAHAIMAEDLNTAAANVTLTDAATIAVDWAALINGVVTLTANRVLGNPTNEVQGQWRTILVKGDSATPRTLTFDTEYGGAPPTLTDITSTKFYLLSIYCKDTSKFLVSSIDGSD